MIVHIMSVFIFLNPGCNVQGYLKGVGSVKAHSVSSVLRKAGHILSHVISAFAICSFSFTVPALQPEVTRCLPACRQFRMHSFWQKEATKAVPGCILLLPGCDLLPGWPGCLGSHAITKIAITIQVKSLQQIFSRRRSILFSTKNMRGPCMHTCFFR